MGESDDFGAFDAQFSGMTAAAVQVHELYRAYVDAGFSEDQALQIVLVQIASATRSYGCGGHQ